MNIEKCNVVLGMIGETRAKALLLLSRIEKGDIVTAEEVDKIEMDVLNFTNQINILDKK